MVPGWSDQPLAVTRAWPSRSLRSPIGRRGARSALSRTAVSDLEHDGQPFLDRADHSGEHLGSGVPVHATHGAPPLARLSATTPRVTHESACCGNPGGPCRDAVRNGLGTVISDPLGGGSKPSNARRTIPSVCAACGGSFKPALVATQGGVARAAAGQAYSHTRSQPPQRSRPPPTRDGAVRIERSTKDGCTIITLTGGGPRRDYQPQGPHQRCPFTSLSLAGLRAGSVQVRGASTGRCPGQAGLDPAGSAR